MKFTRIALAVLCLGGAGSSMAAPALQVCAPLEVIHNGSHGLTYSLACDAGAWHLVYAGSVPAGDAPVNAQYRVTVNGPEGTSFVQNRVARLPSPANLGQILAREAVVLDTGDLALRDCKEAGCTQYRPLGGNTLAKSAVTVPPETQRLQAEQKKSEQEVERLTKELAEARIQALADKEAAVAAEQRKAAEALAALKADYEQSQAKVAAQAQESAASLNAAQTAEAKHAVENLRQERETLLKRIAELEAEVKKLTEIIATMSQELALAKKAVQQALANYEEARQAVEQQKKLPEAQRTAYEYVITDLVSQHNAQVQSLKRAMPGTDFKGVLGDLKPPKVAVKIPDATESQAREPSTQDVKPKVEKVPAETRKPAQKDEPAATSKSATPSREKDFSKNGVRPPQLMENGEVVRKLVEPRPAQRYKRTKGQWYDMWTEPPTPVDNPRLVKLSASKK